jgi:catechol 2,3-dioxygenase
MSQIDALKRDTAHSYFQPRRLGHANLFVKDYAQAADYYSSVVGIREVYRQPDNMASFVSNGNTYHDLGLTDVRSRYASKNQGPGLWHLAFELETEVDLVTGYRQAINAGVKFAFMQDHDVAHSLYQHDPDGLLVEIYADVMKDWRSNRHGTIIKEKPDYVPGVTSPATPERNYPQNPKLEIVKEAVFHPKKVTHVALVAVKYEEMVRFYTERVGLVLLIGNERSSYAVLRGTTGAGAITLYRQKRGLEAGFHHVGFEVWNETDLDRSLKLLPRPDTKLVREIDHPARRSIVVQDPDGIYLQFYVNRTWTPEVIATASDETALYLL